MTGKKYMRDFHKINLQDMSVVLTYRVILVKLLSSDITAFDRFPHVIRKLSKAEWKQFSEHCMSMDEASSSPSLKTFEILGVDADWKQLSASK